MKINIKEVLELYKSNQVDDFIERITGYTLNEKRLKYQDISNNWKYLGNTENNASPIGILKKGEKGIIERLTNAIDAVIEKQVEKHHIKSPQSVLKVIEKAFPEYYKNLMHIYEDEGNQWRNQALDTENQVILAINDGSKSNKPTIDIIDKGIGLTGDQFDKTILSINQNNKISSEKKYTIGAFGHGGSTSLPFTESTIIVSKKYGKYYFTVIKSVDLTDHKFNTYVYLTIDDKIPELDATGYIREDYIRYFLESESGTLVRMIETDISREYRHNDITKPGMLIDYINTELFKVQLPIKIIENRKNFIENRKIQNRYVHGSYAKLKTHKYVKKEYSGHCRITYRDHPFDVEYYVILPNKEEDWGSDSKCKEVFEQINIYGDPIIYTVNGQTISTEGYTKIKNNGLTFLRYRLLVIIDLDSLGSEKYKFFTTDRAQIKETDITKGFLDEVVKTITQIDKLKEINDIIAERSISSSVDTELLSEIKSEVQSIYSKYLKTGLAIPYTKSRSIKYKKDDEVLLDDIFNLLITSEKRKFYKNELIRFILTTGAEKHVNSSATIDMYIDGKSFYGHTPIHLNGRIEYQIQPKVLSIGKHSIQFFCYKKSSSVLLESELVEFEILDQDMPDKDNKDLKQSKTLDINIQLVEDSTLICNVAKNEEQKRIDVLLCLNGEELRKEVYGYNASTDEINEIKHKVIKPVVLFALFLGDNYDNISSDDDKNKLMVSYIKSIINSNHHIQFS